MELWDSRPVRCKCCNPINHLVKKYKEGLVLFAAEANPAEHALTYAGLDMMCCRDAMMNPVYIPYPSAIREVVLGHVDVSQLEVELPIVRRNAATQASAARARNTASVDVVPAAPALSFDLTEEDDVAVGPKYINKEFQKPPLDHIPSFNPTQGMEYEMVPTTDDPRVDARWASTRKLQGRTFFCSGVITE